MDYTRIVARILIIPDKFKGTLTAQAAASAMALGWKRARPEDILELLPMSDGGDGFGEVQSELTAAKPQRIATVDAAHQKIKSTWWWNAKTKTAVIESARVIGLAMLPPKKFHPFQLDTFGLGKLLIAAANRGARACYVGIGGSATNDGGFGMARAVGWRFLDKDGSEIDEWIGLAKLDSIAPPERKQIFKTLIVAVDVKNPLLGKTGCSRVYGPQKGLRPGDFAAAEAALRRVAAISRKQFGTDFATVPGAGAAGGLGFGLMAFLGARPESGFDIFATNANLTKRVRAADLVLTGEGALDEQTLMGKGVGRVALLCRKLKVPCVGVAGVVTDPKRAKRLFAQTRALVDVTTVENAKNKPAKYLAEVTSDLAAKACTGMSSR